MLKNTKMLKFSLISFIFFTDLNSTSPYLSLVNTAIHDTIFFISLIFCNIHKHKNNLNQMSQIILSWLNDEIQLSKRITDFQEDFSNGFLLGELLAKYNQQLNFAQFDNKEDKKSKIKNFQLLFDSFSSLSVTFSSIVANQIINKKVGVAKKLLYELKMHLEKTNSNAFTKLTKMTKTLSPLKKLKVTKQSYDKVDKQHFLKQLNELHPAQKTLNQQKLLKKFSDFHEKQINVNHDLMNKQQRSKQSQQKRFRQKQLDNLKKTADFRNEWERTNMEKWEANMTVRHIQKDKDEMFKSKLQNSKFQNKTMSELNAIKSLDNDIKQFQRKFVKGANKKTVKQDSDESSQDQMYNTAANAVQEPRILKKQSKLASKLKFISTSNQQSSLGLTQQKKKPSAQVTEQQKHQRQKKRRKMIVQQNKRYQLIQISRREKYILSTIQQTSKQQKELEYEIWRVWQNKQIITENKHLQEQKQKQKIETREINAKFKRDQLLKTYREEHAEETNQAVNRQEKLLKDKRVSDRKNIYGECKKIIQQFIQVGEQCFLYEQQKNQSTISQDLLDHLFAQFVQNTQTKEDLANLEIQNYIHGKGQWKLPVKRKTQDQPSDPTQDNALPQQATNNYVLGNILRILYENKCKQQKSIEQTAQNIPSNQPQYVFSLLGSQFSGKHVVAQVLRQKHGFNIIQIQKLIFNKIQEYEAIKDKVSEISDTTRQLVDLSYKGSDIPNQLIIKLIHEEILKFPKSILINFPTSYSQALQISQKLSGTLPSDFIKKSPLQQKISSFSHIVWPTPSKSIQKSIKQCGIDLVLWIDINDHTSYDRFLGRRNIQGQIVHIKDDISDKVNQVQILKKASPQIKKNYEKKVYKQQLEQYFEQFGIHILSNASQDLNQQTQKQQFRQENTVQQSQNLQSNTPRQQVNNQNPTEPMNNQNTKPSSEQNNQQPQSQVIRKSWQTVDGHCSIQEIKKKVLDVLEETMQIKNMKRQAQKRKLQQSQNKKEAQKQIEKLQEQTMIKCVLSPQDKIKEKLQNALGSVVMDQNFVEQLCKVWQGLEKATVQSLAHVFLFVSSQQQEQQNYFESAKRNFINLLTRQDKKFSIVKEFQINYNKFFQENKEIISQDHTKDELHQRVDDLEEVLFQIIELKKQDAIEQRKSSLESGWIESQLEQFYNCVRILLQAELNRYYCSEKVINDFYSKKYGISQPPSEQTAPQINYDTSLQMTTKQGTFPRLQKLISQTLRIFNKEEEVIDDKNKKGGKAPPPKKDDKKGGKKGQVEQVKQLTPQQIQMKRAINIEKSIFRYRLGVINEFSTRKISGVVKENQSLYKFLEAYLQYTFEIENRCVFNLSKIFREKIEREEKIQNQVQVDYVDVIVTEEIRNFQKQKPVILQAKQQPQSDRFTISNILHFIKLIQNESQSHQKISTKRLNNILVHLQKNQIEKQVLPQNWKQLTQDQIQKFVTHLDSDALGYIQLWKIFIFILMSNFEVPNQQQVEEYANQLTVYKTENKVGEKKFLQTQGWFDQQYEHQEEVRTFNRNEEIKQIIFDVINVRQGDQRYLQGQKLVKSLGLKWFKGLGNAAQGMRQLGKYYEMAFQRTSTQSY